MSKAEDDKISKEQRKKYAQDALALFKQIKEKYPNSIYVDNATVSMGTAHEILEQWDEAIASYEIITNITSKFHFVGKDNSGGGKRQFSMGYNWPGLGTIVTEFFNSGDAVAYLATDGGEINDTNWHHLVGQRRGGGFEIYVDGILVKSGTTSGTPGMYSQYTCENFLCSYWNKCLPLSHEFLGHINRCFRCTLSRPLLRDLLQSGDTP